MSKKVLVISSSLRRNSNSDQLAAAFAKGAEEGGNEVELITLKDKEIKYCIGCLACQKTQRCIFHDDADTIREKMLNADILCFATPVYYYGMSGLMKVLLDRMNPLYTADYKFRDIYLLTVAAEDEPSTPEKTIVGMQGWIDCFEKARLAGTVFAGGVAGPGEIAGNKALDEAYKMGNAL